MRKQYIYACGYPQRIRKAPQGSVPKGIKEDDPRLLARVDPWHGSHWPRVKEKALEFGAALAEAIATGGEASKQQAGGKPPQAQGVGAASSANPLDELAEEHKEYLLQRRGKWCRIAVAAARCLHFFRIVLIARIS